MAKVTGKAKYAEDFRADGMVFVKLMPSPRPHARVRSIDARAALAMPGVHGILTREGSARRRRRLRAPPACRRRRGAAPVRAARGWRRAPAAGAPAAARAPARRLPVPPLRLPVRAAGAAAAPAAGAAPPPAPPAVRRCRRNSR